MQTDDLRPIVEALDRAMLRCLADGATLADSPALRQCWARLVAHLAPGAGEPPGCPPPVASWSRTLKGWAVNLDGTDASLARTLPRIELRTGPRGWVCVCHLEDGTSRLVVLAPSATAAAARRACIEACAPVLGTHALELLTLSCADAE